MKDEGENAEIIDDAFRIVAGYALNDDKLMSGSVQRTLNGITISFSVKVSGVPKIFETNNDNKLAHLLRKS